MLQLFLCVSVSHTDKLSPDDDGTFHCVAGLGFSGATSAPRAAGESAACVTAGQIGLGMKRPGRHGLIDGVRKGKCGDVAEITTVERQTSASDIRLVISSSLRPCQ